MRHFYIFQSSAAGNSGDDAQLVGWRDLYPMLPDDIVGVLKSHDELPSSFANVHGFYNPFNHPPSVRRALADADRLLVCGGTIVQTQWPLQYHSEILAEAQRLGKPVDFVGVGVEPLNAADRTIFDKAHHSVRSWTLRSPFDRENLLALDVPPDKIRVAADLAMLFDPNLDYILWARAWLHDQGVDVHRPLIAVCCVNEHWNTEYPGRIERLAELLRLIASKTGASLLLLSSETRPEDMFDYPCQVALHSHLGGNNNLSYLVPNRYLTPSQMAGIIGLCRMTLTQRLHFGMMSLTAGVPAMLFSRFKKMEYASFMTGMPIVCDMAVSKPDQSADIVAEHWLTSDALLSRQQERRSVLGVKALYNPTFLYQYYRPKCMYPRLAAVDDIASLSFRKIMMRLNHFAETHGLMTYTTWSKVWEYPWLWNNALAAFDWAGKTVVDIGTERSPMAWVFALLGARVHLVEVNGEHVPMWELLREKLGVDIHWHIVSDETLPFPKMSIDAVTSFSVIEHQPDKAKAIAEVARVLKPGGLFALSFDICEPTMGHTFPEWNGRALTLHEFENEIWLHPAFDGEGRPEWNIDDVPAFVAWHLKSAPHHNYTVGAAILRKRP